MKRRVIATGTDVESFPVLIYVVNMALYAPKPYIQKLHRTNKLRNNKELYYQSFDGETEFVLDYEYIHATEIRQFKLYDKYTNAGYLVFTSKSDAKQAAQYIEAFKESLKRNIK